MSKELQEKLALKRPLRVKFGVDPTGSELHLGHTIPLFKLRSLQEEGHVAVLVIGDFTASIGDPTGRNKTRPELKREEIDRNAQLFQAQAFRILKPEQTEVVFNSTWFDDMTASDLLSLQKRGNATQMLQRRDFKDRLEMSQPIALHELLYPILQGWDSVMVQSDVELGGTDQLFNLMVGRDLQEQMGQSPQAVITTPLLVGLDGKKEDE